MTTIEQVTAQQAESLIETALIPLLQDVVDAGASIGFLAPLSAAEARNYWQGVLAPIAAGEKLLFVARADGHIVGAVQLALEPRVNGRHRAEVQKLMVHTSARKHGLGRRLMEAVETAARSHQRTLIVLDTRRGDVADGLYQRMGYIQAGVIPRYAISSSGELDDTVFYYQEF